MRPAAAGVRIVFKCWVAVFGAHGPTFCFSPTRTGVLADLSRCKPLPGIAVNGALVWRQVTAAISGSTSGVLAGLDNAGYRRLDAYTGDSRLPTIIVGIHQENCRSPVDRDPA
jgi:hypothetical protein